MINISFQISVLNFADSCLLILCCSLLHTDRDPIPDVPAVYFVMPSEENVKRICQVSIIEGGLLLLLFIIYFISYFKVSNVIGYIN